jgi:IS30 family transposase
MKKQVFNVRGGQCARIAERLNNRPGLRLGFQTPNEVCFQPFCRTSNVKPNISFNIQNSL